MIKRKQSAADKTKHPPDDDGRPVADMNVDGMPWYGRPFGFGRRKTDRDQKRSEYIGHDPPLSPRETRNLMIQSVVAALVIGLIFLTAIFLFIMFSLHVWLR